MSLRLMVPMVSFGVLVVGACSDPGLAPSPNRADLSAAADDLAVAPDLAAPDLAAPDLAPPPDMTVPPDLTVIRDLFGCAGGYLNSNDPNACPLSCSPLVEPVKDEGAFHLPFCTPINYAHNPPASGDHWPWPAPWGVHTEYLPREWWVHNLEHQGIVLLYNCPYPKGDGGVRPPDMGGTAPQTCVMDGGLPAAPLPVDNCAKEIAQLVDLYSKHPQDNWWDMLFEVRIVVTGDPYLPGRFAAVAWDWAYVSDQLDIPAIQCFIDARYGRGPEAAP